MTNTAPVARTNQLALIAFIAAFVIPLAGLILSVFARRQLERPESVETGMGLVRWAMVIGILGTLFQIGFFIIWFTLFFGALSRGMG